MFCDLQFVGARAFPHVAMHITSTDAPSGCYPGRRPTLHFEGDMLGRGSIEDRVQATVHDEGRDVIGWRGEVAYAGSPKLVACRALQAERDARRSLRTKYIIPWVLAGYVSWDERRFSSSDRHHHPVVFGRVLIISTLKAL